MIIYKRVELLSAGDAKGVRIVLAVKERALTRPAISKNVAVAREPASVRVARGVVGLLFQLSRSNLAPSRAFSSGDYFLSGRLPVILHPDQMVLQSFSSPVYSAT